MLEYKTRSNCQTTSFIAGVGIWTDNPEEGWTQAGFMTQVKQKYCWN